MQATYDIKVDQREKLVRVRVAGVWTIDMLDRYNPELHRAVQSLSSLDPNKRIGMIVDMRDYGVQTKEVAEAVQASILSNGLGHLNVALVTSESALQTLQAKRVTAVGRSIAYFSVEDDAVAWLRQKMAA